MAASSDATAHFNRTHSRSQSHTGFPVDCLQSIACRCHLHRPGPLQPFQNLLSQPCGTSVPRCPLCLRAAASVSTSHPCGRHRHDRITERPPQGGTPGWQATRASPPCSRSQHHRDGPHDEKCFTRHGFPPRAEPAPPKRFRFTIRGTTRRPRAVAGLPCQASAGLTACAVCPLVLAALSGSRDFESPG